MKPLLCTLVVLLASWSVAAQAPTTPPTDPIPTLTLEQRQSVQLHVKDLEIALLKAQSAQKDYDAAKEALTRLAQELQRPGYTLDLQAVAAGVASVYTKVAAPPAPDSK